MFLKTLESNQAILNTKYIWEFEIKARPSADFKLSKDNKEVKIGDRITIEKSDSSEYGYSIHFKKIEPCDIGKYKLIASNKFGIVNCEAVLSVAGSPAFIRRPEPEVALPEKKPAKIEFEVAGMPIPEVFW